jgi:hypothetical protein
METYPITTSGSRFRHVLLAADLDGSSTHAADEAIDLAAAQGAVLLVLTVVPIGALGRCAAAAKWNEIAVTVARARSSLALPPKA